MVQVGAAPHTEIILVEDDTVEITSQQQNIRKLVPANTIYFTFNKRNERMLNETIEL